MCADFPLEVNPNVPHKQQWVNLRYLVATENKRRGIFKYFHENNYDIVLVQETHSNIKTEKRWKNEWGGKIIFSHGETNAKGVAILLDKNLGASIKKIDRDDSGRELFVKVVINDTSYLIGNLYAPNEDCPNFFARAIQRSEDFDVEEMIIGGDLNVILDPDLDRKSFKIGKNYFGIL